VSQYLAHKKNQGLRSDEFRLCLVGERGQDNQYCFTSSLMRFATCVFKLDEICQL
jgi:hypothetical protein